MSICDDAKEKNTARDGKNDGSSMACPEQNDGVWERFHYVKKRRGKVIRGLVPINKTPLNL